MTFNKELDIITILPEDCVKWSLKDLGKEEITYGRNFINYM